MKLFVNNKIEDFKHDYDFVNKKNKAKLKYSHNDAWIKDIRGKVAVEIKDDGSGVQISTSNYNIYLGYHELQELQLILSLIEKPNYLLR